MGYYTSHSLEVLDRELKSVPNLVRDPVIDDLRNTCEGAKYSIDGAGDPNDSTKWYEHAWDMCQFSKRHPDLIFMLWGNGEESGDTWRAYYSNGREHHCQGEIVYPVFDWSKLEEVEDPEVKYARMRASFEAIEKQIGGQTP